MNVSIIVGRFAGFTGRLVHADAHELVVEIPLFGTPYLVRQGTHGLVVEVPVQGTPNTMRIVVI